MFWFVIRKLLFLFSAETAHHLGLFALRIRGLFVADVPLRIETNKKFSLCGVPITSPLGLAAGFDKDAKAIPGFQALGFGFIEVGTVTLRPQEGNPRPRLFRLPDSRAIINRMGFNSDGASLVASRLERWRATRKYLCPIGVNLGKNKTTALEEAHHDYCQLVERFYSLADYLVINISSPNTPGLRELQNSAYLPGLLRSIQEKRDHCAKGSNKKVELFLKLSPDLVEEDCLYAVDQALAHGFGGIIATNTTNRRDLPGIAGDEKYLWEKGGLSGRPLAGESLAITQTIRHHMGNKATLISVGGIDSVAEVQARLAVGADLVQIYTGLIYEGPSLARRIREGV